MSIDYLPRRPQYVRVRLDNRRKNVPKALTFHWFGAKRLKRGDRICVNEGQMNNEFGTVTLGYSPFRRACTYGVRRTKIQKLRLDVTQPATVDIEVA